MLFASAVKLPTHWLARQCFKAWLNTLTLCFDELPAEPKSILIIGGCRQQKLAQTLALCLPATKITLLDPDLDTVQKAERDIHCRFKFVHGAMEQLPFPNQQFDLTIAHNAPAYLDAKQPDWDKAIAECHRVTRTTLVVSQCRPGIAKVLGLNPDLLEGTEPAATRLSAAQWLTPLTKAGKMKAWFTPYPWAVWTYALKGTLYHETVC